MRQKRHEQERKAPSGISAIAEWKYTTPIIMFACGAMLIWLIVLVWKMPRQPPIEDFEGLIADRWAGYNESDHGSRPYFRLLVEIEDKKRITVGVDPDLYHRSRVGMGIRRRNGRIELMDTPETTRTFLIAPQIHLARFGGDQTWPPEARLILFFSFATR